MNDTKQPIKKFPYHYSQQTTTSKQQTTTNNQQPANNNQQTANSKQQTWIKILFRESVF